MTKTQGFNIKELLPSQDMTGKIDYRIAVVWHTVFKLYLRGSTTRPIIIDLGSQLITIIIRGRRSSFSTLILRDPVE